MFGTNPLRKLENDPNLGYNGARLRVQSIFRTIQGEGPLTGTPAIFLRLAGCSLKCFRCDTNFESNYQNEMLVSETTQQIVTLAKNITSLVVITGGEPLIQNILPICKSLIRAGFIIQIETSGTTWVTGLERLVEHGSLTIVCSPKTGKVCTEIQKYCRHWKYLICEGEVSEDDGLPNTSTQVPGLSIRLARPPRNTDTVWLQPCEVYDVEKAVSVTSTEGNADSQDQKVTSVARNDVASKRNMQLVAQLAMQFNYRVSLQLHKILNLE